VGTRPGRPFARIPPAQICKASFARENLSRRS
jgi:hypothetical protein